MAGKKVIKAHRGFAHVPMRGRRRPPMRPPVRDPRRPQRDPRMPQLPRQLPRNFNQMSPRARMQFMMERDLRAGNVTNRNTFGGNLTPAMRRQMEAAMRRRARRFYQQRRRRRRPIGTPIPQQRQDRARMLPPTQQVRQAQPVGRPQEVMSAPATSYPAQEVRQARPEPMERATARRVAAKGKFITKKNIGANDYRQGGMVLNSVDNRKNKK